MKQQRVCHLFCCRVWFGLDLSLCLEIHVLWNFREPLAFCPLSASGKIFQGMALRALKKVTLKVPH